jgi:hypothetical protein
VCPLCREGVRNSFPHLFKGEYYMRILNGLKNLMSLPEIMVDNWPNIDTVLEWWEGITLTPGHRMKEVPSLIMLTTWDIWNKRNGRVFLNTSTIPIIMVNKIQAEARNCASVTLCCFKNLFLSNGMSQRFCLLLKKVQLRMTQKYEDWHIVQFSGEFYKSTNLQVKMPLHGIRKEMDYKH